jgi:hypothetical protein
MTSLYRLQTALINAAKSDQTGQIFKKLRDILKSQWDELLGYLQRCHAFGEDVSMLKDALETERTDDRTEFLTDMQASAKELREASEKLREKASQVSVAFVNETRNLVEVLKVSSTSNCSQEEMKIIDFNRYPESAKPASPVLSEVPKARNDELQAFIDANLAAAYPDGWKALFEADGALVKIAAKLDTICQFWGYTSDRCQRYLVEFTADGHKNTPGQADQMIASWKQYKEPIEKAISFIAKTNDAIPVQAVGAPAANRRNSYSFFEWVMEKKRRLFGR